jgi:hypothetical protein
MPASASADCKPDSKPESKADSKPDGKPESKPDGKPDGKPDVFDVDCAALRSLEQSLQRHKPARGGGDLVFANNSSVLAKFCDVCKRINLDPLHPCALPFLVIFMSKNKHCVESARAFMQMSGGEAALDTLDMEREGMLASCEQLLNSMGDWLALFAYLELSWRSAEDEGLAEAEAKAERQRRLRLRHEIEANGVVRRMQASLAEGQVAASGALPQQQLSPLDTALLALLFLSPRATPAGKMLERLYTDISDKARDAELRCLRAMAVFKDTMDDEEANMHTMPLVMRCFRVRADFARNVAVVLRKQLTELEQSRAQRPANSRQLLRAYARSAVQRKQTLVSQDSWVKWRNAVSFSVNTSSHLQRLMYFIAVQPRPPQPEIYQGLYTQELCARAKALAVDVIDVQALQMVLDSLRLYMNNVKQLIDFSAKCLQGVNQEKRQKLSLVQVLQLYIACFQHDSVWKECWRHVLPVMNHTIASDCAEFRRSHAYDVDAVVLNLIRSLID